MLKKNQAIHLERLNAEYEDILQHMLRK